MPQSLTLYIIYNSINNTNLFLKMQLSFSLSIGIRMLDGNVTDTIEGGALSYKKDYIDIYSCAWGPKDDGKRFGRPGTLASKALELGVREVCNYE